MPKSTLPDEYAALLNDLNAAFVSRSEGNHHMTNSITSHYRSQMNDRCKIFRRYRLGAPL
jgi:hypothetical protein